MPYRSVSAAYLRQVTDIQGNAGQLAAYNSTGHCVVLAGPGSGKTKTLVLKLARILAEDVAAPRGVACITYSHECARELKRRLDGLNLREAPNLFVGTVHGFCLRHLLMPYSRLAGLPVPYPITVASPRECRAIHHDVGTRRFGVGHPYKELDMGRHRRVHLDRASRGWQAQEELAALAQDYEAELRRRGLVDFDDLVILGHTLVTRYDWVLRLVGARFPVLAVDEYQDLGVPLHRIVKRLAFHGGIRLFAVGDADQSIYGFTGADGDLLMELSGREDVETIRLEINYRSAGGIVRASEIALGENRGYRPQDPRREATIEFVECRDGLRQQAQVAVSRVIPAALAARPGRCLGDIAILYRDYRTGNIVAEEASNGGLEFTRVDRAAPYRKCSLTSWIEDCAAWSGGGWREGVPQLRGLLERWHGFRRGRCGERAARMGDHRVTEFLWDHRGDGGLAAAFVRSIRVVLIHELVALEPSLGDQHEQVEAMAVALEPGGPLAGLALRGLGNRDGSPEQLNLLTLHSAKGCEYDVVVMLGLDLGSLPWRNEEPEKLRESRRLFYVGLTRARDEVYMLYSGWVGTGRGRMRWGRSPFLKELQARLDQAEQLG